MLMVLLLGWVFLPIYISSGVRQLKYHTLCTCVILPIYSISELSLSSPGDDHARILAEAVWGQENPVVLSRPLLIYLHLHKDIGMIQIHRNSSFHMSKTYIFIFSTLYPPHVCLTVCVSGPGGHVCRCNVHSARPTMEHLPGCGAAAVHHCSLHCNRLPLTSPCHFKHVEIDVMCLFCMSLTGVCLFQVVWLQSSTLTPLRLQSCWQALSSSWASVSPTAVLTSPALDITVCLTLLPVSRQASPRSEAGTLSWRGTPTPSLRSACQTQPAASLETTPSTYSETR